MQRKIYFLILSFQTSPEVVAFENNPDEKKKYIMAFLICRNVFYVMCIVYFNLSLYSFMFVYYYKCKLSESIKYFIHYVRSHRTTPSFKYVLTHTHIFCILLIRHYISDAGLGRKIR